MDVEIKCIPGSLDIDNKVLTETTVLSFIKAFLRLDLNLFEYILWDILEEKAYHIKHRYLESV